MKRIQTSIGSLFKKHKSLNFRHVTMMPTVFFVDCYIFKHANIIETAIEALFFLVWFEHLLRGILYLWELANAPQRLTTLFRLGAQ